MKKFLFFLLISFLVFSCGEKKDYGIEGYLTGYFRGKIVLKKVRGGKLVPVDSVILKKSRFKFKHIKIQSPEMFWLDVNNGDFVIQFFADRSDMKVDADFNTGELEVRGSGVHNEYVSFLESNEIYESKSEEISEQRDKAFYEGDTLTVKSLDSVYDATVSEQIDFMKKYAYENNKSFVSLYITLYNLADYSDLDELKEIFDNFDDTLKISPYYKELKNLINVRENTAEGRQAPDFSLPEISDGNIVSLSSLQGKNVLIVFSASWNGACRADNLELKKIYDLYDSKDFEILQIFIDTSKKQTENVIKADGINWITVSDFRGLDSDVLKLYGVRKLPYYFLLDKNGIILKGGDDLKSASM